ncbi:MAG TPA: methyl-accepting chemotaxis protein [Motiliproteus sp.]
MGFIYDLRITVKLFMLMIAGLLGIAIIVVVNLTVLKDQLYLDRQEKTRTVVDMAYSQLEHYAAEVKAGRITLEEAQQRAKVVIGSLRYEGDNYLWINDYQSRVLMHPIKPSLNGQDMSNLKDVHGKAMFVEFVRVVKADGAGFVEYFWPKPGNEQPVAKLSYVKGYKDWGWIVGSGIYVDDVDSIFLSITMRNLLITGLVAALMIGFSLLVSGTIRNSIAEFKSVLTEIHVDGNLGKRLAVKGGDEIGAIAVMVNGLLDAFKKILEEVGKTSQQLNNVSGGMRNKSQEAAARVEQMHVETQMVATAVTEMTAAAQEVARNASSAAEQAKATNDYSESANKVVSKTTQSIQELANEVREASEVITRLSEDSNQIWSIVEVINNIADQTNLLALNAAIEAARAGEQGRGFAVVADEVRSLAQKTQNSTKEIQEMISNVQRRAEEAVGVMARGQSKVESSVTSAEETRTALAQIDSAVSAILEMNYQIATAAEEQTATTEEINGSVIKIKEAAESNGQLAGEASGLAGDVDRLTQDLTSNISKFRL